MTTIRRASLNDPSASRAMSRGTGTLAAVGPLVVGRAILEPGWRWSQDVRPVVGTEWCETHHVHVLTAGRFAVRMAGDQTVESFEPGDVFDIPPHHDAWVLGDEPVVLLDIAGNIAGFGLPTTRNRRVVTMVMSDIVDSTPTAARLGDAAWRQHLAYHERIVRTQIDRYGGNEIDTTGDGFFVAFDSAAAAVECARSIRDEVHAIGLQVRIGVHTGEIELAGDHVRGIAVHAVARIMAAAGPSEVFASPLVRSLTEGTGIRYIDRGPHVLKGITEPMTLFEVARTD